ncbi:DNA polymerase III beta subunit [Chitinivibrio alkaliphilus ACht1]|uniref:Beta sliding clamp n=2 Tax=Chitinivibrio TaxID=1505231 RepID=U7D5Z6_9BACT|nr:DNA polymerase III beta subunit [Chitinivibrio alkaliphilus ACht1]
MNVTVKQKKLYDVLQKVFPIVPSRTSLQVLTNLKLSVTQGLLTIYASDLDNFVQASLTVSTTEDIEIAVDARKFTDIIREMGNDDISLTIENNVLYLENGSGFNCSITGVGLREFPLFPETEFIDKNTISTKLFKSLFTKSSFAVSRDESRGCLCGLFWDIQEKRTGMVATDGHRLGASFTDISFSTNASIILSPKSIGNVLKIAELEDAEDLEFVIQDKYVVFYMDHFRLSTKMIQGPYPDYEKGIPHEFSKRAQVERAILLEAIKRVSTVSNSKNQLIKMIFTEGNLNISAQNREIGGFAEQNIPITYTGDEDLNIGFNSRYLQDILSVMESREIIVNMNNHLKAVTLLPHNSSDTEEGDTSEDIFLIMPLKIFE